MSSVILVLLPVPTTTAALCLNCTRTPRDACDIILTMLRTYTEHDRVVSDLALMKSLHLEYHLRRHSCRWTKPRKVGNEPRRVRKSKAERLRDEAWLDDYAKCMRDLLLSSTSFKLVANLNRNTLK